MNALRSGRQRKREGFPPMSEYTREGSVVRRERTAKKNKNKNK
jgi:hypothetical protein